MFSVNLCFSQENSNYKHTPDFRRLLLYLCQKVRSLDYCATEHPCNKLLSQSLKSHNSLSWWNTLGKCVLLNIAHAQRQILGIIFIDRKDAIQNLSNWSMWLIYWGEQTESSRYHHHKLHRVKSGNFNVDRQSKFLHYFLTTIWSLLWWVPVLWEWTSLIRSKDQSGRLTFSPVVSSNRWCWHWEIASDIAFK